jgi:hypothetical protein
MKLTKMWLDGKPNQNLLGTSRANRNGVSNKQQSSVINEDGNLIVDGYGDPKKVLGVIVLDNNDFVVFIKKSPTNSEIGYVDNNQFYHTVRSDDRLAFDLNKPIHGEFQRNSKGERIIVYTDASNVLRYENIDTLLSFNNTTVFSDFIHPDLRTIIESGGNLPSGAWYPIIQYEKADKVVTSWIKDYNPVYIVNAATSISGNVSIDPRQGNAANVATDKQIRILINNPDTRFSKVRIGVVFQANNVRTAFYIKSINIVTGQSINATISDFGTMTPITLDEVIIDRTKYKTVQNLTQLNNTLYLQGLGVYQEPKDIQQKINNIRFRFKHTLFNIYSSDKNFRDHSRNNEQRHFQHGEVYAMYCRLEWPWGWGQWRHIPGRESRQGETAFSIDNFKVYQTGDTCSTDGTLGYWENEDELYPTGDFYPTGKVRHIKFPSLRWMKQNIYNGVPDFGGRKMSILNLEMDQTTFDLNAFQDCYGNKPINFQIGYAKRTETNGLVVGQSITHGSMEKLVADKPGFKSFGMNLKYNGSKPSTENNTINIRTYDFASLWNKTAPNINYIRSEFQLVATVNVKNHEKAPSPYEIEDNLFAINANFAAANNVIIPPQDNLTKVNRTRYILNNTIYGNINNTYLEDTVLIELANPIFLPAAVITDGLDETSTFDAYTQLITYLNIKRNCYNEFYNQEIIVCDENVSNNIYGGDTYIGLHNINTFGDLPWLEEKFSSDNSKSQTHNTPQNGVRTAQQFLAESLYNTSFRYTNPGTQGGSTQYVPQDDYIIYLPALLRDQEPNSFSQGYTKDYNAQNDLTFSNVYNPNDINITHNKFAITRGATISNEGDIGEWLNFKLNDVYYLDKTRGEVVYLGAGKDFLIIHHKNALFRTRERTQLESSTGQAIFTGQGDIFANAPEEIIFDERGALGTQHRWSCLMTKYGYFWVDSEAKKIYRYTGEIADMTINGMSNFFIENLDCVGDNPFNSYGFHIVIDETNRRLILTKKSMKLKPELQKRFKGVWKSDKNFLNSLKQGDIIFKDGNFVTVN